MKNPHKHGDRSSLRDCSPGASSGLCSFQTPVQGERVQSEGNLPCGSLTLCQIDLFTVEELGLLTLDNGRSATTELFKR